MSLLAGSIESLNYGSGAGSPYLAGTQYFACIKRQTGFCGVKVRKVNIYLCI